MTEFWHSFIAGFLLGPFVFLVILPWLVRMYVWYLDWVLRPKEYR